MPLRRDVPFNIGISRTRPLLVTAICLFIWRLLARIPVPYADPRIVDYNRARHVLQGLAGYWVSPVDVVSVVTLGLRNFIAAFVLVTVVRNLIPGSRSGERWVQLAVVTAILTALAAGSESSLFVDPHDPHAVANRVGVLMFITAGSMAMFGLGRLIDRWGAPAGSGVWLMYFAQTSHQGFVSLVSTISSSGRLAPGGAIGYAIGSVLLLIGLLAMVDAHVRFVLEPAQTKARGARQEVPFYLLQTGLVLPVFVALIPFGAPIAAAAVISAPGLHQALLNWRFDSVDPVLGWAFSASQVVCTALAAYLLARINFDPDRLGGAIQESRLKIVGVPQKLLGPELARRTRLATLIGGLGLGLLVALPSQAYFRWFGGQLHLGGSTFVYGVMALLLCVRPHPVRGSLVPVQESSQIPS